MSPTVMIFLEREASPENGDYHVAQVGNQGHQGHHEARDELRGPGRPVELGIVALEGLDAALLGIEGLDDQVSAVHFLDVAVDPGQGRPAAP